MAMVRALAWGWVGCGVVVAQEKGKGAEAAPVVPGAVEVLKQTRVIIMECYNFMISPDCLTFPEMCALLAGHGFRCADMADVLHREKDGALWQMDIAFVRDDAAVFADNSYR